MRGKVTNRADEPLGGVVITVQGHPEFGQTLTRADGMFDLAVNGGGYLAVNYAKRGFLPCQRQVQVPWQDYAVVPEVVLIPIDPQVTEVDLLAPAPIQVARGSVVTDDDGSRQATLLIPQGTTAQMDVGGVEQALTSLHLRATEYTIGPNGPNAMPGELPRTTG